ERGNARWRMRLACAPGAQVRHGGFVLWRTRSSRYIWLYELCFVCHHKIKANIHIQPQPWFLSFQLRHCLLEQLAIQIETHCYDVAALRGAENAARAANLQIAHGD